LSNEDDLLTLVRAAWAEVLGHEDPAEVPLDTNFLETAGSSLLLILLWEKLHVLTEIPLRVSDLFQHSTVRSQAMLLAGAEERAPVAVGADRSRLLDRARRERS
jgi:hypothetical protein